MRKIYPILFGFFAFFSAPVWGQLPDGSVAPNWTLTDIEGVTHTLYDYLDNGKTVVIDFSATWCAPCWAYHNSGAMEGFYEEHGPSGDNTGMVFFIESDLTTNMNDLLGLTLESQGNWIDGTPYPIIDVTDYAVPGAYMINYFPTIYEVCPDRYIYEVGQVPTSVLSNWIISCSLDAQIAEVYGTECFGLGEGAIELMVSGGYGSISFSWSNGVNTQNNYGIEAGLYDVTVTEGQGKEDIIEGIYVSGPESPIEITNANIEDVNCFGETNGAIDIDVTGGNSNFTYTWSNGESGSTITNLPGGLYTVTVLDANNCDLTQEFEVFEPELLELDYFTTFEWCDQGNGTIEMAASGGIAPYAYAADGGIQSGNNPLITNLIAGDYSISVTDANGCLTEHFIEITNIPAPQITMPANQSLDCNQNLVSLNPFIEYEGNLGLLYYEWTTSDGNIVSGENNQICEVDQPGTYVVLVTDLDNGCESEASVIVSGNPDGPQVEAGENYALDCQNLTITLEGQIPAPPSNYTVIWSTNDGNIVSGENTLTPQVDAGGTYTLQITDTDNGCTGTDETFVLDLGEEPQAEYAFNANDLIVQFNNMSTGPENTYSWAFGDGSQSTEENPLHTYGSGGMYLVCLTATNGCGESQTCYNIEVEGAGQALTVQYTVTDVSCNGLQNGAVDLTAAGGSGVYAYEWTGPGEFQSEIEDVSGLAPGQYQVVVTDDDGNEVVLTIIVNQPDPLEATLQIQDPDCQDPMSGTVDLSVSGGTAGYTFSWSNGVTTEDVTGLSAGVYSCTIIDQNNCVLVLDQIVVAEQNDIESAYQSVDVDCYGEATGSANVSASGGTEPYNYVWSNGAEGPEVNNLPAGSYICTITDLLGCASIVEVVIDEPPAIDYGIETSYNKQGLNLIDLTVNGGTPGYTYLWNNGYTGEDLFNVPTGTYQCTITDENGCITITNPVQVTNPKDFLDQPPIRPVLIDGSPANQPIVVHINSPEHQQFSLMLFNVAGQLIASHSGSDNSFTFDITNELPGIYFLSIFSESSWISTERIIITD